MPINYVSYYCIHCIRRSIDLGLLQKVGTYLLDTTDFGYLAIDKATDKNGQFHSRTG